MWLWMVVLVVLWLWGMAGSNNRDTLDVKWVMEDDRWVIAKYKAKIGHRDGYTNDVNEIITIYDGEHTCVYHLSSAQYNQLKRKLTAADVHNMTPAQAIEIADSIIKRVKL